MRHWKSICLLGLPVFLLVAARFNNQLLFVNDFTRNRPGIAGCSPSFIVPVDGEEVTINDNRQPAGELRNGVFYLSLEVKEGYWYPESKNVAPVKIRAFAEAGKSLQVPGPLIRVREGIHVRLTIRNTIKETVSVFGLTTKLYRPGAQRDSVLIKGGETLLISFNSGDPGTYLYTAKDENDVLTPASVSTPFLNSQLYGAYIVDPVGEKIDPKERIFMIGMCGYRNSISKVLTKYVINGLSWPYTERLHYKQGEEVNWRIINASVLAHPMHLHGFPFVFSSFLYGAKDSIIPVNKRKPIVTQDLVAQNRMRMRWVPEKSGNWLFHCHLVDHTLPATFFADQPETDHSFMSTKTHAEMGMGGLIMGIQVERDPKCEKLHPVKKGSERKLTLLVGNQPQNFSNNPNGKGFQLLEDEKPASEDYSIPGPPIILMKGQPVAIKIVNNLQEPTTIHWHGMVVESYYDGVAGWGNAGNKIAPLIQPGDSFTVHINPSEAGTFMYHTHMHDKQLLEGLYGMLIVLPPGEKYDPETERLLVISQGGSGISFSRNWLNGFDNVSYLINGCRNPPVMEMKKGTNYNIRLINISSQQNSYFTTGLPGFEICLKKDGKPVPWKVTGKDGYFFPAELIETVLADKQKASTGTTHDYQFTPVQEGEYLFEAKMDGIVVVTQKIRAL